MNNEGQASGEERESTLGKEFQNLEEAIEKLTQHPDTAAVIQRVRTLRAKVEGIMQPKVPSLLQEGLPESQRQILESILALPNDAYEEAQTLIDMLDGQPMTEVFAKSFAAVLREKKMGVECETCNKASILIWHVGKGYAQGGRAQFSHSGPSLHGSITKIRSFKFVLKTDKRLRAD